MIQQNKLCPHFAVIEVPFVRQSRPPDKSAYWKSIFSLFLIQDICIGFSKEPSQ